MARLGLGIVVGCHHADYPLHILSGCQCPVIRNMLSERHSIGSRMILKVFSEGSMGSADRLVQHDLDIPEQVPNREMPPYLSDPSIPDQANRLELRDATPAALMLSWSLFANSSRPLLHHIGYSAV
eukprot:1149151-Pelagomonas_calceolata.AAC.2